MSNCRCGRNSDRGAGRYEPVPSDRAIMIAIVVPIIALMIAVFVIIPVYAFD